MTALAVVATDTTKEFARYKVSVWQDTSPSDEPLTFNVGTPGRVAEAVLWLRGDPSVTQVITTDTLTGRQLTIWTR